MPQRKGKRQRDPNLIETAEEFHRDEDYVEKGITQENSFCGRTKRKSAIRAKVRMLSCCDSDDEQDPKSQKTEFKGCGGQKTNDRLGSIISQQIRFKSLQNKEKRKSDELLNEKMMNQERIKMQQEQLAEAKRMKGLCSRKEEQDSEKRAIHVQMLINQTKPIIEAIEKERIDSTKRELATIQNDLIMEKLKIQTIQRRVIEGENLYKFSEFNPRPSLLSLFKEFESCSFKKQFGESIIQDLVKNVKILSLVCKRFAFFCIRQKIEKKQLISDSFEVIILD